MKKFRRFYLFSIVGFAFLILFPSILFAGEEMILIPAGEFIMGNTGEVGRSGIDYGVDEVPARKVYVEAFYIDKYEVTRAEYREYLKHLFNIKAKLPYYEDQGIPLPEGWELVSIADCGLQNVGCEKTNLKYEDGMDNHPVNDVDWYMSRDYCQWIGKRLPTEEEWEKAARGTDGRLYPWGNEKNNGHANTREAISDFGIRISDLKSAIRNSQSAIKRTTFPNGSFPKDVSPYGVYDMGGNVAEWTASLYRPYPGSPVVEREVFERELYVVRGGSYLIPSNESAYTTARYFMKPTRMSQAAASWHGDGAVGFRCARSVISQ